MAEADQKRSLRVLHGYCPKISVVVTSYNYGHVLRETLDALVTQTYPAHEILVVDNGSKDDSVSIIREYAAKWPAVRLLQHEGGVNKGLPASVKLGTETATGEFIAFCEADDLWRCDHLARKVELLRGHWGEPNFIVNDFEPFGDPERCAEVRSWMETRRPVLAGVRNRISPVQFRDRNWICTFSICMVRRSALLNCDMLSVRRPSNLDWWLWRQVAFDNDVWCVHEPLTRWRLHKDSYLMRDAGVDRIAEIFEMTAQMDRLLVRRHPALADSLRPFLREEDLSSCENGVLSFEGSSVEQPGFSVVLPVDAPATALEATLGSLSRQTYGAFEVLLVSRGANPVLPGGVKASDGLESRVRTVFSPCADVGAALERGIAAAGREWVVPLLPGDVLRPEALQTFAARIILNPAANGVFGCARRMERLGNFGGFRERERSLPSGPFACVGAFAFRTPPNDGDPFSIPAFSHSEGRVIARFFATSPICFTPRVLLLYDDRPDGHDPGSDRLLALRNEVLRLGPARRKRIPDAAAVDAIRKSPLFDEAWYLRENPDVRLAGVDPARHYLAAGVSRPDRQPSPDFIGDEYLALNPDVGIARVNPLVHFERFGRKERRPVSFLQTQAPSFPSEAVEREIEFPAAPARPNRRVALFAAFSASGRIPETTLLLLRGLREVCDEIVFVMGSPLVPGEEEKLRGLVRAAVLRAHDGYDFLSWKIAREKALSLGLLDSGSTDELVVVNDSCYGPVLPFAGAFATMQDRSCDFWGLTANAGFAGVRHLQSYFLVFRRRVLDGPELGAFFNAVEPLGNRWRVVLRYEVGLTTALSAAGYAWDSLVPRSFADEHRCMPTKRPLLLMRDFRVPLVKVKALSGDMADSRERVLAFLRRANPALAAAIPPAPPPPDSALPRRRREDLAASFRETAERISRRVAAGGSVRVIFLVTNASMFPARPLFDAMRRDGRFEPRIFIAPDMRGLVRDPEAGRRKCREDLGRAYPDECFLEAAPDELGCWPDVIGDNRADVVCYPSPYDVSCFRFNPHWAVGRSFLPIHVNYGFYRSVYDREVMARQNYAYFWKAFFECAATAKEYAEHSILHGANAEVVGYVKMDALASAKPWPRNGDRKRVLLAPHHSVEGGANDTLALSNFQRYSEYFLSLPERHPELDFVFRPHPFLFTVLAHPSRWGAAKVEDWIARMKAHENVFWSDEGDYFPVFASCDACVQDCGSYLVEWLYTGKPCCYLLKSPSDVDGKFAPLGRDCLALCHLAYDEKGIEAFVRDVVSGGVDPKTAGRDAFRKSVMVNHPHAADAALQSIRKALGMEPA